MPKRVAKAVWGWAVACFAACGPAPVVADVSADAAIGASEGVTAQGDAGADIVAPTETTIPAGAGDSTSDVASVVNAGDASDLDAPANDLGSIVDASDTSSADASLADADATGTNFPDVLVTGPPTLEFITPATGTVYWGDPGSGDLLWGAFQAPQCQLGMNGGKCFGTEDSCDSSADCMLYAKFAVSNFALGGTAGGAIHCHVDGNSFVFSTAPSAMPSFYVPGHPDIAEFVVYAEKQGLHAIDCNLALIDGTELTNPEARAHRTFALVNDPLNPNLPKCATDAGCDDGNACSSEVCVAGKCQYTAIANCCWDDWMCALGQTCLDPNTSASHCGP